MQNDDLVRWSEPAANKSNDDESGQMSKGDTSARGASEPAAATAAAAAASRRSRSRGRTPSELLARKQRLASTGRVQVDESEPIKRPGESAFKQLESAEAKLESLSAMLRTHQVSSPMEFDLHDGELPQRNQQSQPQQDSSQQLKSVEDVYILLAKKEKDLQLAAELGKVLLERNEDLSRANERIAEDYSHKLELLEQEKHKLKRKLDQLDGEYENRLIELQTDCNILKTKLDQQQQASKQAEKERAKLIEDLVQQNQRLTGELAEATRSEELLANQLEQVNERLGSRLSNRSNHVAQVDALQEEIQILNQRKQDLERRLKLAQGDKAQLSGVIDELGDKVLLGENLLNEKDLKLAELAIEINELRDSSAWLSARLESMISLNERLIGGCELSTVATAASGEPADSSDLRAISERDRSQLVEQLKELRLRRSSRIKANELILNEADERRLSVMRLAAAAAANNNNNNSGKPLGKTQTARSRRKLNDSPTDGSQLSDGSATMSDADGDDELRDGNLNELISEIHFILSNFLLALQQRKESLQISSGAANQANHNTNNQHNLNEDSGIGSADEIGQSRSTGSSSAASSTGANNNHNHKPINDSLALQTNSPTRSALRDPNEWRRLVDELRQLIEELPCSSCQLMVSERADFGQLRKMHTKVCEEIRLKNDELLKLNAQNIELTSQLGALEDKCHLLTEDLESCDKPKDEIVQMAWRTRDEAVQRKNNVEIQLAKTRIENMQISSQLMEVVQQKGELSQKLAQFEDDIHYMMQRSVRQRFSWEEYAEETRRLAASKLQGGRSATSQLINLVPSITSNANAQGSSSIQHLLSLTGVTLLSPTRTRKPPGGVPSEQQSQNGSGTPQLDDQNSISSQAPSGTLLTSFKSGTNRFNLRFWQRNSSSSDGDRTVERASVES